MTVINPRFEAEAPKDINALANAQPHYNLLPGNLKLAADQGTSSPEDLQQINALPANQKSLKPHADARPRHAADGH